MGFFSRILGTKMPPEEVGRNLGGVFYGDLDQINSFREIIKDLDRHQQIQLLMELHVLRAFLVDFGVYQVLGHSNKKTVVMDAFSSEMCNTAVELADMFGFKQYELVGAVASHSIDYASVIGQVSLQNQNPMIESGKLLTTFLKLAKVSIPNGILRDKLQMQIFMEYVVGIKTVMEFVKEKA